MPLLCVQAPLDPSNDRPDSARVADQRLLHVVEEKNHRLPVSWDRGRGGLPDIDSSQDLHHVLQSNGVKMIRISMT